MHYTTKGVSLGVVSFSTMKSEEGEQSVQWLHLLLLLLLLTLSSAWRTNGEQIESVCHSKLI